MWIRSLFVFASLAYPASAQDQPLSAIDWLSDSLIETPAAMMPPVPDEPPVANSAAVSEVTVTPLDAPTPDGVGLLPTRATGLPANLWGPSESARLITLIEATPTPRLPALQELLRTLLLAEVDPPVDADPTPRLLLARVDALLATGAIEPAQALLERAGTTHPEIFRRWFDLALLTGTEDAACETLRARPGLTPSIPTRVFCLARTGDWSAAALTLENAKALDQLTPAEDALLIRFLEPELAEELPSLAPPTRITPLEFRMREALGEPLPTTNLPRAFAAADLRSNIGWKAQLDAAERLARVGAISENQLLGIYSERRPSASGGVWDRVQAIQRLDRALDARDAEATARHLPTAWAAMQNADLEVTFARLVANRLENMTLDPPTRALADRIELLGPRYEQVARELRPGDRETAFLKALALGNMESARPPNAQAAAIKDAFLSPTLPRQQSEALQEGRLGEAILTAIVTLDSGAGGDQALVTDGLAVLREVGLEATARQAALQLLLMERG